MDQCKQGEIDRCSKIIRTKVGFTKAQHASAYFYRGLARRKAEDYEAAIEDYSAALHIIPRFWEALDQRGRIEYEMERYGDAVDDFTAAIALNKRNLALYRRRGFAHSALKEYAAAARDMSVAIARNGKFYGDYQNRGIYRYMLGDYADAYADYSTAIGLKPSEPNPYCERGRALIRLGRYEDAVADLRKALKIKPDHSSAKELLEIATRQRDRVREEARRKAEAEAKRRVEEKHRQELAAAEEARQKAEEARRKAEEEKRRAAEAAEQARQERDRQLVQLRDDRKTMCASGPAQDAASKAVGLRLDIGFAVEIGEYKDALAGLKALEKTCVALEAEDLRNAALVYYQTCDSLRALDAGNRFVEAFASDGQYAAEVRKVLTAIEKGEPANETCS